MYSSRPCNAELLSALVDGQLADDDLTVALAGLHDDPQAEQRWQAYHLIGETLRSSAALAPAQAGDRAFLTRFQQRLAAQPLDALVVEPSADVAAPVSAQGRLIGAPVISTGLAQHNPPAANDPVFRWKLVAGFASVTALGVLAWSSVALLAPQAGPQLAQSAPAPQIVVATAQGPVVRDARLQELLAAHKQMGGSSALQLPAGFLRNATYDMPAGEQR